jgi:hypothetical protein
LSCSARSTYGRHVDMSSTASCLLAVPGCSTTLVLRYSGPLAFGQIDLRRSPLAVVHVSCMPHSGALIGRFCAKFISLYQTRWHGVSLSSLVILAVSSALHLMISTLRLKPVECCSTSITGLTLARSAPASILNLAAYNKILIARVVRSVTIRQHVVMGVSWGLPALSAVR